MLNKKKTLHRTNKALSWFSNKYTVGYAFRLLQYRVKVSRKSKRIG